MTEPALPVFRTVDDFLAWENEQEERYEFVGGVIRLMAGGTLHHDLVSTNVAATLRDCLRGGPCRVHGSNLKVRSPVGASMYPDAFVRCGPANGRVTNIGDAVLVVEVLSPSTGKGDLTEKRWAYQGIDTLRAILFVAPDRPHIELSTRQADGAWLSQHYVGIETRLPIACFDVELPMAEIYDGVDLDEPGAERAP